MNVNIKRQVRVSQANWLNLLPGIQEMDVLKVGTKKLDNIFLISYSSPKTLSCIGAPVNDASNIVKTFYNNIDDVPASTVDLVILDEEEYLTTEKSFKNIKKMLLKISCLLRDKGALLLCFPDGKINIKYRFLINKALSSSGFSNKIYYFCDPSAEEPMGIVPYSSDSKWLIGGFPNLNENPFAIKVVIKNYIKRIFINIMKTYYPFRGLILVANKSVNVESYMIPSFDKIKRAIKNNSETIEYEGLILRYVCFTGKYLKKHYLFFYNQFNDDIVLIAKVGYKSDLPIDDIDRERKNLTLMSDCEQLFNERDIKIATLVHYECSLEKSILIQSAVLGKSLRYILNKHENQNNNDEILRLLGQITDAHIYIQDICSQKLNHSASRIDNDYFTNYTNIHLDDQPDQSSYLSYIQHGDFTANNIFFDARLKQWGVIDWEWLSIGFPPIFDLFSLFTSVRFSNTEITKYNEFEGYYISFTNTFFDKNWFSDYLVILLERYCNHFNLKADDTYTYFVAFILFHCNKFRMNKLPVYQHLYERMLMFAEENKDNFILNQAK